MKISLSYRIALICGVLPLLVGILIFLLWLATRWEWLVVAGFFTLYGGVAIFSIGVIALARYWWLAFRTPTLPRRRLWLSTLGCAVLLLSNFVVAGGIMETVIAIESRYTVIVKNASEQPLKGVRVAGGGCKVDFGTIPPGENVRSSFWIKKEGTLELHAECGVAGQTKVIDEYVCKGMGGQTTVTIDQDGTISFTN